MFVLLALFGCPSEAAGPPSSGAVQRMYLHGVPHTDRRGERLLAYQPGRSFFPIASWGKPLSTIDSIDWSVLRKAGFNTVWPWPSTPVGSAFKAAHDADLQVVLMQPPSAAALRLLKDEPAFLGIVWTDEPTGKLGTHDLSKSFSDFLSYRMVAKSIVPNAVVFVNDVPWITPPARDWWLKWNTAGDVSCHDNYPIQSHGSGIRSIGMEPNGIPQVVAMAVKSNKEAKPVWVTIGAFEQPANDAFPFRFPTPTQLRAEVFAALIHGATGITYFTSDSVFSRDGGVIGMSPLPVANHAPPFPDANRLRKTAASPMELIMSSALWESASQINGEIAALVPSLYSPTADVPYRVDFSGTPVSNTPIRAVLKVDPSGGYQLLTVNLDDAVLEAEVTFDSNLTAVDSEFENRQAIRVKGQSFHQRYEPFDVHVFHVSLQAQRQ